MLTFDPVKANEPLLQEITDFCGRAGISVSEFGERALNDRALVTNLRAGRQLTGRTLFKVRALLESGAEDAA